MRPTHRLPSGATVSAQSRQGAYATGTLVLTSYAPLIGRGTLHPMAERCSVRVANDIFVVPGATKIHLCRKVLIAHRLLPAVAPQTCRPDASARRLTCCMACSLLTGSLTYLQEGLARVALSTAVHATLG